MIKFEKIELDNLDEILQTHAYDFQEATRDLPELRNKKMNVKLRMDKMKNKLYLKIRGDYEVTGEKFTEGKLNSMVEASDAFIQIQKEYLEACYEFDKVYHLQEVFHQRELSLKLLVNLYTAQYWTLSDMQTVPRTYDLDPEDLNHKDGSELPKFKRRPPTVE